MPASAAASSKTAVRPLAVVTGASSGIGLELAKVFAKNGYDLLLNSEDGKLDVAAAVIEGGVNIQTVTSDLTTTEGVHTLVNAVKSVGRPPAALALNAGVGVGGDFLATSLDAELKMIALNCTATVHLAKHLIPLLVANGGGHVLMTASVAAIMPAPFEAVYGATKAFVKSFSEGLRAELQDRNVKVTALMPGPTETNFFHRAGLDDTKVGVDPKDDPAQVAQQGFDALMAGKDHIVAGSLKNKAQTFMAENILPEKASAAMHKSLSKPGSGKGKTPTSQTDPRGKNPDAADAIRRTKAKK